jgi:hypothetical protein
MKRALILIVCLLGSLVIQTQTIYTTTSNHRFYDEFQYGNAFFTEGDPVRARFNYNFVLEEMEFLNQQNNDQILTLVRKPNITHIEIGHDIFVPIERGGWAVVIQDGPVSLLGKRHFIRRETRRRGAYGTSLATSGAYSLTSLSAVSEFANPGAMAGGTRVGAVTDRGALGGGANNAPMVQHLQPPVDYRVETKHWLMKDRKVYSATRRNFLRLYHEIRPQLEAFINENRIDFKDEQHLRGLTRFANSLVMAL